MTEPDRSHISGLPHPIRSFLLANHVVGLATQSNGGPWAASCFYAFDEARASLIILSDEQTRHGQDMLANPKVAGTIAGQPTSIPKIQGIQFFAYAHLLAGRPQDDAFKLYSKRHPIARIYRSSVWQIRFQEVKFTDNSKRIGCKTYWRLAGFNPDPSLYLDK